MECYTKWKLDIYKSKCIKIARHSYTEGLSKKKNVSVYLNEATGWKLIISKLYF